jgi:membrane fusion protein, multidrug efflux system
VDRTRWIAANFRETQLTNIKPGDSAEVRVDIYPNRIFKGRVVEVAPASGSQFALLPPDNATGNFTKSPMNFSELPELQDGSRQEDRP